MGNDMPQSRAFILRQTAVLLRLGIAPADIEHSISFVDAHLPPDADAAIWIPSAADLSDDMSAEAAVVDARAAYYVDKRVPRRFRKLLDAREVE
jgi:hypothetical protein